MELLDQNNTLEKLLGSIKENHSEETKGRATELLNKHDEAASNLGVKDFFTYGCDENELPYEPGDVVLTVKDNGAYIMFYTFDRIIYDNDDQKYYIYSYKRKRYPSPFKLNDGEKKNLKDEIDNLYKEEAEELDRSLLEGLVSNS